MMNIKISSISFNKKFMNILNLRKNKFLNKDIKRRIEKLESEKGDEK